MVALMTLIYLMGCAIGSLGVVAFRADKAPRSAQPVHGLAALLLAAIVFE
jgi:hypothetical protein